MGVRLEDAILLAVRAHRGQKDKAGAPYILHPLRVMAAMKTDHDRMAAVLHDVVEDCGISLKRLKALGFPAAVVRTVDRLTKREGESYEVFIARAGSDPRARRIKLADLADNMDLSRITRPGPKDRARLEKYRRAWKALTRSARGRLSGRKPCRTAC